MSSRPPSYNHAPRRAPGLRAAVAAVALLGVVGPAGAAAQGADPWPMAGRDPAHTAVAGDLLVHTSGSGSATAVVARTLTDGRELWRAFVDSEVGSGLVAADGLVYAATAAGELIALHAETGGGGGGSGGRGHQRRYGPGPEPRRGRRGLDRRRARRRVRTAGARGLRSIRCCRPPPPLRAGA